MRSGVYKAVIESMKGALVPSVLDRHALWGAKGRGIKHIVVHQRRGDSEVQKGTLRHFVRAMLFIAEQSHENRDLNIAFHMVAEKVRLRVHLLDSVLQGHVFHAATCLSEAESN